MRTSAGVATLAGDEFEEIDVQHGGGENTGALGDGAREGEFASERTFLAEARDERAFFLPVGIAERFLEWSLPS